MQLDAKHISGMRVALWAYDGDPITTITVPIAQAERDHGSTDAAQYDFGGLHFAVDQGRNRFGGTTFGDQLILDTREKDPRKLAAAMEQYPGQLAIEVVQAPAQKMEMGKSLVVKAQEVAGFARGAEVSSRHKLGQIVHTFTFPSAEEGLKVLRAKDARFASGAESEIARLLAGGTKPPGARPLKADTSPD